MYAAQYRIQEHIVKLNNNDFLEHTEPISIRYAILCEFEFWYSFPGQRLCVWESCTTFVSIPFNVLHMLPDRAVTKLTKIECRQLNIYVINNTSNNLIHLSHLIPSIFHTSSCNTSLNCANHPPHIGHTPLRISIVMNLLLLLFAFWLNFNLF